MARKKKGDILDITLTIEGSCDKCQTAVSFDVNPFEISAHESLCGSHGNVWAYIGKDCPNCGCEFKDVELIGW